MLLRNRSFRIEFLDGGGENNEAAPVPVPENLAGRIGKLERRLEVEAIVAVVSIIEKINSEMFELVLREQEIIVVWCGGAELLSSVDTAKAYANF